MKASEFFALPPSLALFAKHFRADVPPWEWLKQIAPALAEGTASARPLLPPEVVERARQVLEEHESVQRRLTADLEADETEPGSVQLTMFTPLSEKIVGRLRAADLDRLTPLEALNLLAELKKQLSSL